MHSKPLFPCEGLPFCGSFLFLLHIFQISDKIMARYSLNHLDLLNKIEESLRDDRLCEELLESFAEEKMWNSFPSLYSAKLSASRGVLRPPFQILDFRICNFIEKTIPLRYPVKVRNDRPFLCLGDTISQKSSRIFWFYHALFGRV